MSGKEATQVLNEPSETTPAEESVNEPAFLGQTAVRVTTGAGEEARPDSNCKASSKAIVPFVKEPVIEVIDLGSEKASMQTVNIRSSWVMPCKGTADLLGSMVEGRARVAIPSWMFLVFVLSTTAMLCWIAAEAFSGVVAVVFDYLKVVTFTGGFGFLLMGVIQTWKKKDSPKLGIIFWPDDIDEDGHGKE